MRSIRKGVLFMLLGMFLCTSLGGCFYGGDDDHRWRRRDDDDGYYYRRPDDDDYYRAPAYYRVEPRFYWRGDDDR